MAAVQMRRPVELIPPQPQVLWGWPAAANFALGGLGAGLYLVAAGAAGLARTPAVAIADWLAPALVLAGFLAVAGEAGRPLRGPRVLARARTSWMSRELWLGGAFVVLTAADIVFPLRLHRAQAMVAALLLVLAQGLILRRARGIAAWDTPWMPPVFLASALVSGGGAYLLMEAAAGRGPGTGAGLGLLALVAAGWAVWRRYLRSSADPDFVRAVRGLAEGPWAGAVALGGYAAPILLLILALAAPPLAAPAAALAGCGMVAAQLWAKWRLVLQAGQLRPITLSMLRIPRRSA